jgi:3-dehydroquinate dehydratase-2
MKKITIINGANLNLLGVREKNVYGEKSFEEFLIEIKKKFPTLEIEYLQSNVEGEIVNFIQDAKTSDGIILNAGGYTHTSVVIRDAISSITVPTIEVHISNIFSREEFRQKSLIAPVCKGSIIGFGLKSYTLALQYFINF